jgi:hypothetical protein
MLSDSQGPRSRGISWHGRKNADGSDGQGAAGISNLNLSLNRRCRRLTVTTTTLEAVAVGRSAINSDRGNRPWGDPRAARKLLVDENC